MLSAVSGEASFLCAHRQPRRWLSLSSLLLQRSKAEGTCLEKTCPDHKDGVLDFLKVWFE